MISVQQLSNMLKNLNCQEVGKKKKNKRRNRKKAVSNAAAVMQAASTSAPKPQRKRRNRRATQGVLERPDFVLTKKEYVKPVTMKAGEGDFFQLEVSTLPFAKNFQSVFERYRLVKATAHYVPSVGANTDGNIIMAVDIDGQTTNNITRQRVAQLQGAVSHPVTKAFSLELPVKHGDLAITTSSENLQVAWALSVNKSVGDLWITYTMHFYGAKPA